MAEKGVENSLSELRKQIREKGLRCTTARLTVLQAVALVGKPISHAELADELGNKGFDRATIYRNLVELAEAGLLTRVELGDHTWRFEVRRPGHRHENEHPHFVCVECGTVSCLPEVNVNITPPPGTKKSGIGEITEILIKGRCGQCS